MSSAPFVGRRGAAALARASSILGVLISSSLATVGAVAQTFPAPGPEGSVSLDLDIIAQQLDIARNQIQSSLGASVYELRRQAIEDQPQGDNAPLNQVLLQAPGVAQDSFGQLHIRGEHANLQYRLNGVQLPEGINIFGQALETRLANSISLITGALPAQYGFRTAGIIDITTKTGTLDPGGSATLYGGQHGWMQPSFEYGGRVGQLDYFITGETLRDTIGIENPQGSYHPIHDLTDQGRGFAYLSGIIDPTARVTAIVGTSHSQFQIPNRQGQSPGLGLVASGISDFDSATLDENQRQITHYGIVTLQEKLGAIDFQVSTFHRYSSVYFTPDPIGDVLFNGVAQTAYRRSMAYGTQGDGSYQLTPEHTLRTGFLIQGERTTAATNSLVLQTDDSGAQTSDQPISILDSSGKTGWLYGVYVQDEWKIVPTVTLNFGGRFDIVDAFTHENQISPRINVVWQPTEDTVIHAGYARYFTPPPFELVGATSVGLFANTTFAPQVTQDSVVKAERSHYFDVGATQIVLPGLKVGVDAYYKDARNLIDEGQFGAPVILTPFNYAQGFAEGVELTTNYQIDNWSLYSNFAVGKAMGKNISSSQFNFGADELAYISNHFIHLDHDQTYTGSAGVAYTFATRTKVSASMIFGSGLRASTATVPNGASLPEYEQVNLSVVQKVDTGPIKGMELRLDVVNLLDKKYQIRNGTGVGVGAPQYGPRRAVFAGLTQRF
jgi:outer membrane receptor protein involved in Fe transport